MIVGGNLERAVHMRRTRAQVWKRTLDKPRAPLAEERAIATYQGALPHARCCE